MDTNSFNRKHWGSSRLHQGMGDSNHKLHTPTYYLVSPAETYFVHAHTDMHMTCMGKVVTRWRGTPKLNKRGKVLGDTTNGKGWEMNDKEWVSPTSNTRGLRKRLLRNEETERLSPMRGAKRRGVSNRWINTRADATKWKLGTKNCQARERGGNVIENMERKR